MCIPQSEGHYIENSGGWPSPASASLSRSRTAGLPPNMAIPSCKGLSSGQLCIPTAGWRAGLASRQQRNSCICEHMHSVRVVCSQDREGCARAAARRGTRPRGRGTRVARQALRRRDSLSSCADAHTTCNFLWSCSTTLPNLFSALVNRQHVYGRAVAGEPEHTDYQLSTTDVTDRLQSREAEESPWRVVAGPAAEVRADLVMEVRHSPVL